MKVLSLKQLRDIYSCKSRPCIGCSCAHICGSEVKMMMLAAETALVYRNMLKRLEWHSAETDNGSTVEVCPICERREHEGHDPECPLGELLKEDGQ